MIQHELRVQTDSEERTEVYAFLSFDQVCCLFATPSKPIDDKLHYI
jgi:hypothetical protein